jgi:hypothetical protein
MYRHDLSSVWKKLRQYLYSSDDDEANTAAMMMSDDQLVDEN